MVIPRLVLRRTRNVAGKTRKENQNKHFMLYNNFFPRKSCRMENYGRARQAADDNTKRRMRIACWIPKATNTHSQHAILIAFPLQQWLQERALLLRYTCIACLVYSFLNSESMSNFSVLVYFFLRIKQFMCTEIC